MDLHPELQSESSWSGGQFCSGCSLGPDGELDSEGPQALKERDSQYVKKKKKKKWKKKSQNKFTKTVTNTKYLY